MPNFKLKKLLTLKAEENAVLALLLTVIFVTVISDACAKEEAAQARKVAYLWPFVSAVEVHIHFFVETQIFTSSGPMKRQLHFMPKKRAIRKYCCSLLFLVCVSVANIYGYYQLHVLHNIFIQLTRAFFYKTISDWYKDFYNYLSKSFV